MMICDVIYDMLCRVVRCEMWDVCSTIRDTWCDPMRCDVICDIWWYNVMWYMMCCVVRCEMCDVCSTIRDTWCDPMRCDIYDVIYDDVMWYMMCCVVSWDVWCVFYDTWYVMQSDAMWCDVMWYMIYLLTAVALTPGGGSTVHIYTQTIHRTTQSITKLSLIGKSVGRAPSLWVIPWHLPYNWEKSTENPQSG